MGNEKAAKTAATNEKTAATANDAANIPAAAPKAEPLTSDKLAELNGQYDTKWAEMVKLAPRSAEANTAKTELFRIDNLIKAEEAALLKAKKDAENLELKNARIALAEKWKADIIALVGNPTDQALIDAEKASGDVVKTELAARYATSAPAAKTSGGSATTSGTSKTDEIFAHMDAGKTYDDLIALGYMDGTIRSAAWKGGYKKNTTGGYTKTPEAAAA